MPFPYRKLKAERERQGLSRAQLADAAGIPVRTIEAIEQGRRIDPAHSILKSLCMALQQPCDFFFSEDLPEEAPPAKPGRPKKS